MRRPLHRACRRGACAAALAAAVLVGDATAQGERAPWSEATLNARMTALVEAGRHPELEVLLRDALAGAEDALGPDHPDAVALASNLAATLLSLGRPLEAHGLAWRAALARERELGDRHPDTLASLENLAVALLALGRPAEAEPIARRVLRLRREVLGSDHPETLAAMRSLAAVLGDAGRTEEALELHRALYLDHRWRLGADHPETIAAMNSVAAWLRRSGRLAEAEFLARHALAARERVLGHDHPDALTSAATLSLTLHRAGRHDEAAALARRVHEERARVLGPSHPDTLSALSVHAAASLDAGRAETALMAARGLLRRRGADRGAGLTALGRSDGPWAAETVGAGGLVVGAARELARAGSSVHDPTVLRAEAFEAAQAFGGGATGDALALSVARASAGEAGLAEVVGAWVDALAERSAIEEALAEAAGGSGPARLSALTERRAAALGRAEAARARLALEHPRFFELIHPAPVSPAELRGIGGGAPLLGETEALILMMPGRGAEPGLVWAVSWESVAWADIGLGQDALDRRLGRLHAMLDRTGGLRAPMTGATTGTVLAPGSAGYDRTLALEVHQALFGAPEIAAVIAGKPDWVLAPQGALFSVPFAALVTTPSEGGDDDPAALRGTDWLGVERSLAVVPSVSSVRALRRLGAGRGEGPSEPFIGLGDPAFDGAPAALAGEARERFRDGLGDVDMVRALPRLPGTRREVERMAAAFGVDPADPERVLLGAAANESRLAALDDAGRLGRARVVLLATHGLMAGDFDGLAEPALALTPPPKGARPIDLPAPGIHGVGAAADHGARIDDGLLTASEVARLTLDADWVILSACDTAAGATPDAAGLSGLARAFFHAGARALLVSHWPVDDRAAERLTTEAVRAAAARPELGRARALQASMRAVLSDGADPRTAHPSHWAPFQLVGVDRVPPRPR